MWNEWKIENLTPEMDVVQLAAQKMDHFVGFRWNWKRNTPYTTELHSGGSPRAPTVHQISWVLNWMELTLITCCRQHLSF